MNVWLSIPPGDYDRHMSHPAVRQRQLLDSVLAKSLDQVKPRSVAILGCATGGGFDRIDPTRVDRITAVDLNADYIEVTRERFSEKLPQLEFVCADLCTVELDTDAYDFIYCALVLEYVEPSTVLSRISRWLRPDGTLVLVAQLDCPGAAAVTETGISSLSRLAASMQLRNPTELRKYADDESLIETASDIETLESGKQFHIGHYRLRNKTANRSTGTIVLRPATSDDIGPLFEIHCAALKDYVERTWGWDEDWQADSFRRNFDLTKRQAICSNGDMIGFLDVVEEPDCIFLENIELHPAHQRRGIGTSLIGQVINDAASREFPVRLQVLKVNTQARSLYERLGFALTDETETHYQMWRTL